MYDALCARLLFNTIASISSLLFLQHVNELLVGLLAI